MNFGTFMKLDIVPLSKWIPNLKKPLVIAGPCSAETEDQVIKTAHELKKNDEVRIFRAGIWKPRTRPIHLKVLAKRALNGWPVLKKKRVY